MSRFITVVGPLATKEDAVQTMQALGESSHSVYSMGEDENERWFVERDTQAAVSTIFGYTWDQVQAKQQGKA